MAKDAVQYFWKKKDSKMATVIEKMEEIEKWAVDDIRDVAEELVLLGGKLSEQSNENLQEFLKQNAEKMISLMTYIFCGKALRIFLWMEDHFAGICFHFLVTAEENSDSPEGRLLLDRLRTLKSINMLNKIFSPKRIELMDSILLDYD